MKKYVYSLMAISTVALLASCTKEMKVQVTPEEQPNTISLVIDAGVDEGTSEETKTYIDGTSIKWASSGEKLKVYEKATTSGTAAIKAVASNVGTTSDGGVTMSFNVTLDEATADNFTYYAVYPSTATVSNSPTAVTANLETKKAQTPTATSFDPAADLLVSKGLDNGTTQPTSLNMQFARAVAIGKMTITNLPIDENVSKVVFSANNGSAVVLSGRTTFNLATVTPVIDYGDMVANTIVEVNTAGLGKKATSSMDVFFTCYPFELSEGNTFTVVVEAGAYQVSRTVTIPTARELNFIAGKVSRFSVDMSSGEVAMQQAWVRFTGAFEAGDYLIVSANQAMTAGVSSDRFSYSAVSPSGDEIYTNRTDMVWRAAASSTYWTLYNPEVEMYAASTGAKNKAQLLESGTDDMSLWTVSGSETYEFVNKKNTANGVNANLRYNPSNGWACYGTGTGSASLLYKKDSRPYLSTPASVTAALNGSDESVIDVTFSAVANAGSYVIVASPAVGDKIMKYDVTSSPATISVADGLAYSTSYKISVYAVPSSPATYRNSLPKEASGTVTTGVRPTPPTGTMVWSEDFTGWTAWTASASGASHVYGGGTVAYTKDASTTFYKDGTTAGGVAPEIMVAKNGGYFKVSDVPITSATSATLFYTTNNQYLTITTTPSSTVTVKNYDVLAPRVRAIEITNIPADTEFLDITLSDSDESNNSRIDNLILKAGTKPFQTLSYANASVEWTIGTDCAIDTEADAPQSVSGANTAVTYTSSNPAVATVNSSTGAITVKKAGTIKVTATAVENGSYWAGAASYTLVIASAVAGEELPFNWEGGKNDATTNMTIAASSDYSTVPKVKFGTANSHYITVNIAEAATQMSFLAKQNGSATNSVITLAGSTDGVSYTTIQTFTINPGNGKTQTYTSSNSINSSYRYLRIMLTTKGSSTNIGVGTLHIE